MAEVIKMENINKYYGDYIKTQVLYNINLQVEESSFNSIIGASGSGKSTLLNILGTLDRPSDGKVFIDGNEVSSLNNSQLAMIRNKYIGFVFQFHYLLSEFTALENVLLPYQIGRKTVPDEIKKRAEELLDIVGLTKVKNNLGSKMSGGQQQRTAIARALINNPKVILADEPTGNLDSESTENVYTLFRDINKKFGTTFIIVTHDRKIAEKTDRIIEVRDGKIFLDYTK
ncbi:MAG TPA: ABC transporter ATP-binding protein [Petrotogaceae bacterium]|jgi:lipoprotein-releasing system ATP-binding protein|nr:ABC transporter ATP-binding protein [Petrotogaceae bacterium]HNY36923.1 ABC transporter ATP-binding protein [Petrotogaceae bacterium]HPA93212.1 ABC transporter ATP-binding protein [Petrotogaceae bacterium]HQC39843.1 ABC transporter ATP-binding protein [Petrotogaceae bacterium]HQP59270.1 ABC transporter ATP-binding protein [Petrotogaceae bacterium]